MKAPPNTKIERTGNDIVMKCNYTRETWYLTCKGNEWVGEKGNCSSSECRLIFLNLSNSIFVSFDVKSLCLFQVLNGDFIRC